MTRIFNAIDVLDITSQRKALFSKIDHCTHNLTDDVPVLDHSLSAHSLDDSTVRNGYSECSLVLPSSKVVYYFVCSVRTRVKNGTRSAKHTINFGTI